MRIGIVSKPWLPVPSRAYGAIEKLVHYLATQLSSDSFNQVYLFAPGDSLVSPSIKLRSLFFRGVGGEISDPYAEVAQAMHAGIQAKIYGLDVLHAHSVDPIMAISPFINIPIVFSFHTFPSKINKLLSEQTDKNVIYTFLSQSHRKSFPWIKNAV